MAYAPQPVPQAPSNGLGTAALVLGIVGVLLAWIPIIGFFGFILGVLAMALGGVGIFKAHKGTATNKVVAYVGTGLGAIAFVVSLVVFGGMVNSIDQEMNNPSGSTGPAPEAPPPVQQATPEPAPAQEPPPAPSQSPAQRPEITAEVFGDGEAMVVIMDAGSSNQNTVQLPESYELESGYVSVSVSRSPSVESYMQGNSPATGEVGCRIIRNGDVVDEQVANGEFANATCSKFM